MSLHNLEWGDVEPKVQGVNKPKTNLLDRKSQQRLGANAQPRYTLGYQLDHVWKKPKALELERIGHNFITLTISLCSMNCYRKPFTQETFSKNNLRVE